MKKLALLVSFVAMSSVAFGSEDATTTAVAMPTDVAVVESVVATVLPAEVAAVESVALPADAVVTLVPEATSAVSVAPSVVATSRLACIQALPAYLDAIVRNNPYYAMLFAAVAAVVVTKAIDAYVEAQEEDEEDYA